MLTDYAQAEFEHDGISRPVYTRGDGPGIVVMHEVPGIYDAVIEFADRLVAAGYRVYLPERFATLQRELGAGFESIEIDSSKGNAHGISPSAHSVVTRDLIDREGHPTRAALDRVMSFFAERLKTEAPAEPSIQH